MMVAALSAHLKNGFFAHNGGYEYPLVLAVVAAALAFAGPGTLSLDHALGIEWSDTYAANLVQSIDPTIPYGSPKYFDVLSRAYIDLVLRHPVEVAKIYASKAAKVLAPKFVVWLTFSVAFIMAMLALYRLNRGKFVRQPPLSAICMIAIAATLLHAAQAIMTVPSPGYFTQANIGLVLIAALAVDVLIETIWGFPQASTDKQESP